MNRTRHSGAPRRKSPWGASRNPVTDHLDLWTSALLVKSTAGRGSNGRLEAYGIKKLRELTLELAVRGKLVVQDSADEPASSLLKRARNEKAKLVATSDRQRAIRTQELVDADKLFELPAGWAFARLGDLALSIKSGGTPSKHNPGYWGGDIPWASVKDLGFGEPLSDTQDRITKAGLDAGSCLADAGSILICTRMGLGKIGEALIDVAINQDLKAVRLVSIIEKQYFITYYKTIAIAGTGMTVAGIKQEELLNFVIPLPPLEEQHRIVAKVDELVALCDQLEQQQGRGIEAHQTLVETLLGTLTNVESAEESAAAWNRIAGNFDTLFTTEHSIDQLKQTILQLAVMGKLVSQDGGDESAQVFLKKIATEKSRLVNEGVLKKEKPLPDHLSGNVPFEVPSGWQWANFEDIAIITSGLTLGKKYTDKKVVTLPYLRVANVQRGYLSLDEIKEIEVLESEVEKLTVLEGDLLITEGGDWDKVGRTAIWRNELPCVIHQNHVFKARCLLSEQNEVWLELYLNSEVARTYFSGSSKQTTNLASINKTQLRACPVALPPLAEQSRIIAKVDELLALCDALKARLAAAQTTQIHLANAIVERAVAEPEVSLA